MERIVSGYCRSQDQARTVLLEQENGQWECDCDFPACTFAGACRLAEEMNRIQEENP